MPDIYVRELCRLLHKLKVTQAMIAERLGIERNTVAAWAGGQRPVPKRHSAPLLDFVAEVIAQAEHPLWGDESPDTGTLLGARGVATTMLLMEGIARWHAEQQDKAGVFDAAIEADIHSLNAAVDDPDATRLPSDYNRMLGTTEHLAAHLRAVLMMRMGVESIGGRHLAWPEHLSPSAYFQQVVKWVLG